MSMIKIKTYLLQNMESVSILFTAVDEVKIQDIKQAWCLRLILDGVKFLTLRWKNL